MTDETAKAFTEAMNRLAAALEASALHAADYPVVAPIGRSWVPEPRTAMWDTMKPSISLVKS